MTLYLLDPVSDARKKILADAKIDFTEWDHDVVAVPKDAIKKALELLEATYDKQGTDYEDVFRLKLQFPIKRTPQKKKVPGESSARTRSRENYIEACAARWQADKQKAEKSAALYEKELPKAQKQFIQSKRAAGFAAPKLDAAQIDELIQAQFDELMHVPKVTNIEVAPGLLLVSTEPLHAVDPATNKAHEIGRFLIIIHTDGKNGGVRWLNGDRRVDAYKSAMNAPHVDSEGWALTHDLIPTFCELIALCEFGTLVDMAIQFIEEVLNEDMAKYISKWPAARKQ